MYIFLLIVASILIAIPIAMGLLIDRLIRKKGYHQIFRILALIPILIFGYFIYDAIFPSESFYREEFERATNIDFPENTDIRFKSATFPDHHGDYSSVVCFRTTEANYNELFERIILRNDTSYSEPSYQFKMEAEKMLPHTILTTVSYAIDHTFYDIGFLSDNRTIILYRFSY